ncbi:hypothetical protein ABPG72_004562 [Tetrahymena utriculariae]
MGCTSTKPHNSNKKRASGVTTQHGRQSIESPELAYQFIMMMKQQQEFEDSNPQLMNAKRIYEQKLLFCPRLTKPAESSIIRKRLQIKLSKVQTQCTIQLIEQDKCAVC